MDREIKKLHQIAKPLTEMIERDFATSVPDRNFELEERLHETIYRKYIKTFTDQLDRMEAVADFVRDDSYHGIESGHHRAYKLLCGPKRETYLESPDRLRRYEFMIEFDFEDASYGIYYGCRGLIMGGDQEEQIHIFDKEWQNLKHEVCQVLNNTFPELDFTGRFQLTNNANNRTYWPFWISLYAGEDIIDVAARATRLMARVYNHFQSTNEAPLQETNKKETVREIPNFTEEKYQCIIQEIKRKARNNTKGNGEDQVKAFEDFFINGEKMGVFEKDDRYEKAWRIRGHKNVEVAVLIKQYCEVNGLKTNGIPWGYFENLILSEKGSMLDDLKKSLAMSKGNSEKWAKEFIKNMADLK